MSGIEIGSEEARGLADEGPTPRYLRLAKLLRDWVHEGRLVDGDAVPSERALARMTSLSRVTVRRALAQLADEGMLEPRHGSGTFVSDPRAIEQPLRALTGFNEDMLSHGRRPTSRWLERALVTPTAEEAMTLGLSPGDRIARLHRLRLADGEPLAVELAVVPAELLPTSLDAVGHSLYAAMSLRGSVPEKALQRMRACRLPAFEAEAMGVEPGEPALYIERVSRVASGRVVEFTRSHYRGDRYDFVAELTIPTGAGTP